AEVLDAPRTAPRELRRIVEAFARDLADCGDLAVGLGLEVEQMAAADQAVADHADADAIVGALHPPRRCGGQRQGGSGDGRSEETLQERAATRHRHPSGCAERISPNRRSW